MQQSLQLNIIPFTAPFQKAEFAFYKERFDGSYPIFKGDLEGLLDDKFTALELVELEKLYTDFEPAKEGAIVLEIDMLETPHFASHYYRHLIRKHFTGIANIMHQNFTSETEVWFLNSTLSNQKYNVYNQFTLKVQYARVTQGHELVLSYDGTTKVLTQSIATINNFQTEFYNWINCEGVLYRWKYFPQHLKGKYDVSYPVVSNTLKPHFEIAFDVPDLKNRYPKYFKPLNNFYKDYLDTDAFRSILPISPDGFYKPTETQVRVINASSNDLLYANGKTGKEPKKDFKYKGPYALPTSPSNFKFFFIYQSSDKAGAVTELYRYFNSGFKHDQFPFPKMLDYIKLPFQLNISKNIEFDKIENAVSTVHNAIKNAGVFKFTNFL